jgi:hypothetical protein
VFFPDVALGELFMIAQTKTKQTWHPSRLEREASEKARYDAEREAARIPWQLLYLAREKYIEWEAFALWVRAIEHAEGSLPDWVAKTIAKRCAGFFELAAEKKLDHPKGAPFFSYHLRRWISDRVFATPWREGWMNAVGYYAVRDLAYRRNEAFAEYCEREWGRSIPAFYPSFREWLKASEKCSDEVLHEVEMREEKRQLIKLMRRVNPRTLRQAVERYVEWEVFAFWTRTALEGEFPLPATVQNELKRRCPGFLLAEAVARGANPAEDTYCRFNRLVEWIEDHKFAKPRKEGWFDVLLYQARPHARHGRATDYWNDWEAQWEKHSAARYPALEKWRGAADRYTFELGDA